MSSNGLLTSIWSSLFLAILIGLTGCSALDAEDALEDPNSKEPQVVRAWNLGQANQQENKRGSWQNFQGAWGKRSPSELQADQRGSWQNFQGSWGKRDPTDLQNDDISMQNEELLKRGGKWSNLHGSWGKRTNEMDADYVRSLLEASEYPAPHSYDPGETGNSAMPLKRDWSKFAGAWGKRPFAYRTVSPRSTNWSSLRVKQIRSLQSRKAWQERRTQVDREIEPQTNFLFSRQIEGLESRKCSWGKRSGNWAQLRGVWGKREDE